MNNEVSLNSSASSELDFTDQWSDVIVLKEISKGAILRQQKLKQRTYKDINDAFYNYDEPSTSKSNQMHHDISKPVCIKTRKTKRRKSPKRCPIRIAELAVPTKRQCIDTWRTKATVIPDFMVERLKQRVLDQKPIVLIADAVNCFERRKRKPRKRIKKSYSVAENNRMKELKILCALFGYKIALKLRQPINLSLNHRLDKFKTIVKEEIEAILPYKKTSRQKVIRNKEILEDISRKVTVWIDSVLDESESNLLEENLLELEEEEGPVLDVIDDLVEDVMIICVPPSPIKSKEILPEDDLSSNLSKDKSTEGLITNITEININELMTDLCTNALEDAERKILEEHEDYLLSGDIPSAPQPLDLLTIGSDSEYDLETVRGELNNLVEQIVDNLVTSGQSNDDDYIVKGEHTIQASSEFEENTNNILQASEDSVLKENNVNVVEDITDKLDITEQTEAFNIELEHEDDTIINDLTNKTIDKNEIVTEIINDLLQTGVWSSESNALDDNNTKLNDTEVVKRESLEIENRLNNAKSNDTEVVKEELLEIENQLNNAKSNDTEVVKEELLEAESQSNNEKESLQNEAVAKDNPIIQGSQDFTQIKKDENEDLSISAKVSERDQIVKDLLITIFRNLTLETALEENETNEDNKKVKFSAIDMDVGVNKKLLSKVSSQQMILQKPSSDYLNLNIDFAPPNENLLSHADESWPQNIALPVIKVTESINKSVTSLGKIFEIDEKRISSESSYVSAQNSEMLINVQLTSMSMGNSNINDMLLAQFQNENEIGTEENKRGNDKPQRKEIDEKKLVKNKRNINETKYDLKPRGVDKNKPKDVNRKIRNKSVEVHHKPEKKYAKTTKDREKPIKDIRLLSKEKVLNKTDRIKLPENKRNIANNRIKQNRTGMKQKKELKPVVSVKKEKLIKEADDAISKEDRGDGLKNEQKTAYSCEKFFSSEKIKLKQNGVMKIDAYDIVKWCKGLENVIENLETWNSWMNSTCKCITYLKQKGRCNSLKSVEKAIIKWKMLHKNIKQDTILWRDMKQRNQDGLKSYKKYYHDIKYGGTKFQVCDCGNN